MKTTNYNIRLDPIIKEKAEKTYAIFGLNLSDAINVFLHKSIIDRGFPFDVRNPQPNIELLHAMEETEKIISEYDEGIRKPQPFTNARDLLNEILSDEDENNV